MSTTTSEVVNAINSLMRFSREDQESMLEVIGDFFRYPANSSVHDPEEDFTDDDDEIEMEIETGNNDINNLVSPAILLVGKGVHIYTYTVSISK